MLPKLTGLGVLKKIREEGKKTPVLLLTYVWNRMIGVYSAGRVAPFSLLVPVTGLLSAMLIHGERVTSSQWAGIAAVLAGLAVFQFGERLLGAFPFTHLK